MNIKVLYHSSTGNTKKLANAIAESLNIKAEEIGDNPSPFSSPVDLLFIGDGIYFGKAKKNTISLIEQLNPNIVKNIAVFATYGGQSKIGYDLKELLQNKGLNVIGEPFICKGQSWIFINRSRPNESDIQDAKDFAKKMAAKIN